MHMLSTKHRYALFAGLLLLPGSGLSLSADEGFPGFQKLMSDEEFRQSGLQKLSNQELDALNQWLIRYTAGEAQVLKETNEVVREAEKSYEIESSIVGEFTGWSGDTLFRLENGQVWKQRLSGRYPYRGPANPPVRISKNWLGFYVLTLIESGRTVGVSRVR
jgi:hypothetical protein